MKGRSRIAGAVLAGLGTWLLTGFVRRLRQRQQKRGARQLTRDAHQAWEGEGGAIIGAAPRSTAG